MGLLSEGTPLTWAETQKYCEHVRQHGIRQFIQLYNRLKDRTKDSLKWGDEVEYQLVRLQRAGDEAQEQNSSGAQLVLTAHNLLPVLQREEIENNGLASTLWRPEYAAYMVEGVPGEPYGHLLAHLNLVEANMRRRRAQLQELLGPDTYALTLTAFPRLGCPGFCHPPAKPTPEDGVSCSAFLPDQIIYSGHPRFRTLTRNIRERRGKKVAINIPVYRDANTPHGQLEPPNQHTAAALPGHIYMDAMGFGMGCCCLQMTFQACSISEAYLLYDQLTPLSPVLLALSAASPVHRGWLADTDTRWRVISGAVDCRTDEELGAKVDENFDRAQQRDAVKRRKFFFRSGGHLFEKDPEVVTAELREFTLNEIVNGGEDFPGLVPLIRQYLSMSHTDVDTMCTLNQYLNLIQKRASGELMTTAAWMRKFVTEHPAYQRDSRCTEAISADLLARCVQITQGVCKPDELLPSTSSKTSDTLPKVISDAETYLDSRRVAPSK